MRARLGYPELLTIRPIVRASATEDGLAGEPLGLARGAPLQILAQVVEGSRNRRQPTAGGAEVPILASVTFLRSECEARGYAPEDGDMVTARANRDGSSSSTVQWYLTRVQYSGKEHTRAKLITAEAVSWPSSRQQREGL